MNNFIKTIDFSNKKVLVIGDVMLDIYYKGGVERISPEAPVPVVRVENVIYTIGGAGNVCNNIVNLNGVSYLVGFTGQDENNDILRKRLTEAKIDFHLVKSDRPTITKMRIVGDHQQIVRVDFEDKAPEYSKGEYEELKQNIIKLIEKSDIIVISDYKKGVCTDDVCKFIIQQSNNKNKKVIVDPKGKDWNKYQNAYFITPNLKELREISNVDILNENNEIEKYGFEILKKYNINNLLVTRSEKGMSLISNKETQHIPSIAKEVFDVSGAGDTVVATLSLALTNGFNKYEAIKLANSAAGVVVGKLGTVPITLDELEETIFSNDNKKILPISKLVAKIKILKEKNYKIVFTNGCFDIIHRGHITYLNKAKQLGNILVLGLNSDNSVKRLKGNERPINNQNDRAEVLSSFHFIDYIVIFEEDTPYEILREIKPDILVKGGDYKKDEVIGREFAGETILIDFVDGYSTTSMINKMK